MAPSRRKKEPKADLHITINPLLIEYFEVLRPIHGREYSEFVEEKIFALISEIAPEKILEMQLEAAEKKVSDIKQAIIETKLLRSIDLEIQKAKSKQANLEDDKKTKLEQHREKMYREHFDTFKRMAKNQKWFQWDTLQKIFKFKDIYDTKEYILGRLKEDGHME